MKNVLVKITSILVVLAGIGIQPTFVHAGECFTGPTYLHDSQVEIKTAVYVRSGPCSDNSGPNKTQRGVVLKAGQVVTAIATNHRWHKVKTQDGQIGWIWVDFIKQYKTTDRFAGQYIESKNNPYGTTDTHLEFSQYFQEGNSQDTTNNNNSENNNNQDNNTDDTNNSVDKEPTKTYNISASMKRKLHNVMEKVEASIRERSTSSIEQRAITRLLIAKLENLQEEKPELKDILAYLIDKLTELKNAL